MWLSSYIIDIKFWRPKAKRRLQRKQEKKDCIHSTEKGVLWVRVDWSPFFILDCVGFFCFFLIRTLILIYSANLKLTEIFMLE